MRKILTIGFIIAGVIVSCQKEEIKPNKVCNCGVIMSDNVSDYSVTIKNNCSGNYKKFTLYQADWMNAYVGSDYCISNVTNW